MSQPVQINDHGIKLLNAKTGRELRWPKVHAALMDVLDPILLALSQNHCIALYTYGIINNRPIRGFEKMVDVGGTYPAKYTSRHSEGLIKRVTYAIGNYRRIGPWPDIGGYGSRAIDIRKALFRTSPLLETSLVWSDKQDRAIMINFLEKRLLKMFHKLSDHHGHGQV